MPMQIGKSATPMLITHTCAADVSSHTRLLATMWPLWDSTTHPCEPRGSGKFHFDYNGDYATERVLIMSGRATLTTNGRSPPVELVAGDAVDFHRGYACDWEVHEPMTKHYTYIGSFIPGSITCDECSANCFAESYLSGFVDLCPGCYLKDQRKVDKLYRGAEYQRKGKKSKGKKRKA